MISIQNVAKREKVGRGRHRRELLEYGERAVGADRGLCRVAVFERVQGNFKESKRYISIRCGLIRLCVIKWLKHYALPIQFRIVHVEPSVSQCGSEEEHLVAAARHMAAHLLEQDEQALQRDRVLLRRAQGEPAATRPVHRQERELQCRLEERQLHSHLRGDQQPPERTQTNNINISKSSNKTLYNFIHFIQRRTNHMQLQGLLANKLN